MQHLEVSGAVRTILESLGVKRLIDHLLHQPKERRWSDVSQMLSGQGVDPASLL